MPTLLPIPSFLLSSCLCPGPLPACRGALPGLRPTSRAKPFRCVCLSQLNFHGVTVRLLPLPDLTEETPHPRPAPLVHRESRAQRRVAAFSEPPKSLAGWGLGLPALALAPWFGQWPGSQDRRFSEGTLPICFPQGFLLSCCSHRTEPTKEHRDK